MAARTRPVSASINDSTNSSRGVPSSDRPAGGASQFERGQGVARRPATLAQTQPGCAASLTVMPASAATHRTCAASSSAGQQVELQVLGATADGVADLLRIGGGQHEHHVRRWLLERLEQCRLGGLGQHVHLVEDVHLVAARRAERRLLDEVAHGVDTVVAGGVELVDVVAGAGLDGETRRAGATRLAVDGVLAVEHLGQDARRGGLAGAARTAEQVGLPLTAVATALRSAITTWSCPFTSLKRRGRYRR
jgi:hypothetical protein